jgi:hypothetical protein
MTARARVDDACRLLGIRRVAITNDGLRRAGLDSFVGDAAITGREFWFGPDGDPLGFYTPAEGLAALQRCVVAIEAGA